MSLMRDVLRFDAEGVGEFLGRPGPYELPTPMFKAVDSLRGNAGLLGQFTDTQPAAGPELLEPCRINFHTKILVRVY
jgi:hypothetical protein